MGTTSFDSGLVSSCGKQTGINYKRGSMPFSGSMPLSGRDPGFKQHIRTLVDLGPKNKTIDKILNQA